LAKQRKKRELQHLRQEPTRRKTYTSSSPSDYYKPGFPMNVLGNPKFFAAFGVVVIFSFIVVAILSNRANSTVDPNVELPTLTPTPTRDPSVTVTASPSVTQKSFPGGAEQVVDPAKQYTATIKTSKGDFTVRLFADKAPNTVNSFVFLAKQGYFDGISIHRVIRDFVIQGGDPTGTGSGGPGYSTKDEPNEIRNTRGTLSMAKVSGASEFGSQFFVNLKDNVSLDYTQPGNKFYPFGEVTSGMDVVDAIGASPTGAGDKPNPPITITTVTIEER
jgi:cyclophilin family peptidyl-prolyl cis-trans isomerase